LIFNNFSVSQCEKFKENCGSCPEKNSNNPHDVTYQLMKSKRDNLSDLPVTVVVGSSHSKILTEQSNLFKNLNIEFIPLPNDLFFYDKDKDQLQKESGLDPDVKYILWGTTQPGTPRKGKMLFDNVLDILWRKLTTEERSKIAIINVGPNPGRFGLINKFNVHYAGYVPTRKQLSVAYRTADISVCTTVSDSGPMMITESCMNETPVVAFDRSIAIDLIEDEETGYLIKNLDLNDMADKIYKILLHPDLKQISKNTRLKALKLHDTETVLNKWKFLFDSLM
jgi:glycosyltransferase involved in cell wall biosynthesis